eukprot:TRINITY_DN13395_c0_g1_i1.p1 TRINITY_DN13395_c0_g1~~TRINITY_DN13395_c0_g1_i1.p1  ORF type:complete len:267 (+),score=89.71 TRINITY_DN13395_c0_g1_i1:84-803(+)
MAEAEAAKYKVRQIPGGLSFRDPAQAHMENLFIGISGLIGAGKSTLAKSLGEKLDLPVYYEENAVDFGGYLSDFYKDTKRYSFPLQIYLLNQRFRQHQQILWQGKGGVQDRTIYEDAVFAKMLVNSNQMDERDYKTYISLFHNMANFMRKPNLIVHLDVSPQESLNRIRKRGREFEQGITLEYLTNLYNAYEEFINDISRVITVIKVDYNTFQSAEDMAEMVTREHEKLRNIHHVEFKS